MFDRLVLALRISKLLKLGPSHYIVFFIIYSRKNKKGQDYIENLQFHS